MQELKIRKELADEIEEITSALLDERGHEINNPKPFFVDVTPRPLSLKEQIHRLVRNELSVAAADRGFETFEEANDFEVDDDFEVEEPISDYTVVDMQPEFLDNVQDLTEQTTPETEPESGTVSGPAPETPEGEGPTE